MKNYFLILFVTLLTTAGFARAENPPASATEDTTAPAVEKVPLMRAYIPGGFDSKNRVRLMVEGMFPNTCYRIREPEIIKTNSTIAITQTALKYNEPCLDMMVSYSQTVNVGLLKPDQYAVADTFNNKVLGQLPVKVAAKDKVGPDDYFYANVKDAYLGYVDGSKRSFVVNGMLPGDCWYLKEKRVYLDGQNVITILPIADKKDDAQCANVETPFVTTVDIPTVPPGRYMLQVRSLNGESIMKLIDL